MIQDSFTKLRQVDGMTEFEQISLQLPLALLRAARDVAADRDLTLGELIRVALQAELKRGSRLATPPDRAEERRIAMIRARFAEDFAYAQTWQELQTRLKAKGAYLQEAGGGLVVSTWPTGQRLCKASQVGASIAQLARRFRAPFPGPRSGGSWIYTQTTPSDDIEIVMPHRKTSPKRAD